MLDKKNYVEVYIWEKTDKMDKGHVSLQLFIDGEADPDNYLSFFPLKDLDKEDHIKITMMEEKVLTRVYDGCFFYPCADNYYYDRDAIGIYSRKNCKIRRVYGLDIHNMAKKIRDLKGQSLIFRLISGSAILKFENHRNCAGAISEVLHAGGIKRLFVYDQLLRACISSILSYSSISTIFTRIDFYNAPPAPIRRYEDLSTEFLMTAMLPATVISRVISYAYSLHEFDCLLFGISLSSALTEVNTAILNFGIILELLQADIVYARRLKLIKRIFIDTARPLFSIFITTGIIKYIPIFFHESSVTTMSSFFLGNIFGRLLDSYVHYYLDNDASMFGYVALIDQIKIFTLVFTAGLGQLIPDGMAALMRTFLVQYSNSLPASVVLKLNVLHDQLTRFSWLIERPHDISTLLYHVEKLESENNLSSSSLTQYQTGFFSRSVEYISLYVRSFFNGR